jgi:hypothetical protein
MELASKLKNFLLDLDGSISILVISLFLITISTIFVMTDIAAVGIAKRSLTQATEAAAQRGIRNLNSKIYYQGEFDVSTQLRNLLGAGPVDPGIPIDCEKALQDAEGALKDWSAGPISLKRIEISNLRISHIECDGYGIQLVTEATALLPLTLPFADINSVEISAKVSSTNYRSGGFSPFGIRIF